MKETSFQKTALAVSLLSVFSFGVQANPLEFGNEGHSSTTLNMNHAGQDVVYKAPAAVNTGPNASEYKHYALLLSNGTENAITAKSLTFRSANLATDDPNQTTGASYNALVLTNSSSLTIDVDTLNVGTQNNAGNSIYGADRGIRLTGAGTGAGNKLTIHANEITSYTGDEFVHVRNGGEGSVANIGTADRRIGKFTAKTGWGKDDYGVAILQVNEGGTINFYADEATFDGSTNISGGVFGSGSYGTLNVDVNKLNIDGNICGTYGLITTDTNTFYLNVRAKELSLKGDINFGSKGDSASHSDHGRTTIVNVNADRGTMTGNVQGFERGHVGIFSEQGLEITGDITVKGNGQAYLGALLKKNGETIVPEKEGGLVSLTGNVNLTSWAHLTFGNGSRTIVRGNISAGISPNDSPVVDLQSAELELGPEGTATFGGEGLWSSGGTIVLNNVSSGDGKVLTISDLNGDLTVAASSVLNDTFANPEDAAKALNESIDIGIREQGRGTYQLTGRSGIISDSWVADSDGTITARTENESLNAFENFNAMTLVAWRGENNRLTQRLGDIRDNAGAVGSWARVYGYQAKYSDGVSIKYKSNAVQAGTDLRFADNYVAGLALSYTKGDGTLSNGSADVDSYSVAAYVTGSFPCGGYFDVIGRAGRMSSDITAANGTNVMKASYDNTLLGLSAEVGYRYNINPMFYVEPQAELSYATALGDDFTAGNGVRIRQDDFQSLVGRLGARVGATFAQNKGSVYLTASVKHDFLGDADSTASLGNVVKKQEVNAGGTWFSYGIGTQFDMTDKLSVYGSLERADGSDYTENYRYNVGLRYVW